VDFKALGERAEEVRMVSSKSHHRHELSGFVGEAVYEGELSEFLPWLLLGELIHVGKHAVWGCGRFQVGNDSDQRNPLDRSKNGYYS